MELVEGTVEVGGERFPDAEAFVDALSRVGRDHGVTVQAFDARYVVSRRHLERALELADRERERGAAIARDRAVEVLLYAAGRRQIDRALGMGVGAGETPVVVLVDDPGEEGDGPGSEAPGSDDNDDHDGDDNDDHEDDEEVDGTDRAPERAAAAAVADLLAPAGRLGAYDPERVREFFGIGGVERDATDADLESLVLERVALLVVER